MYSRFNYFTKVCVSGPLTLFAQFDTCCKLSVGTQVRKVVTVTKCRNKVSLQSVVTKCFVYLATLERCAF